MRVTVKSRDWLTDKALVGLIAGLDHASLYIPYPPHLISIIAFEAAEPIAAAGYEVGVTVAGTGTAMGAESTSKARQTATLHRHRRARSTMTHLVVRMPAEWALTG